MVDARVEIDITHEMAKVALQLLPIVDRQVEILLDSVRARIPFSDRPAAPGEPPHSSGPFRDSWKAGPARIKAGRIIGYAYSQFRVPGTRVPLAIVLDQGLGPIHPHPFLAAAMNAARARIAIEIPPIIREDR